MAAIGTRHPPGAGTYESLYPCGSSGAQGASGRVPSRVLNLSNSACGRTKSPLEFGSPKSGYVLRMQTANSRSLSMSEPLIRSVSRSKDLSLSDSSLHAGGGSIGPDPAFEIQPPFGS